MRGTAPQQTLLGFGKSSRSMDGGNCGTQEISNDDEDCIPRAVNIWGSRKVWPHFVGRGSRRKTPLSGPNRPSLAPQEQRRRRSGSEQPRGCSSRLALRPASGATRSSCYGLRSSAWQRVSSVRPLAVIRVIAEMGIIRLSTLN
jgi:hypothetical protein